MTDDAVAAPAAGASGRDGGPRAPRWLLRSLDGIDTLGRLGGAIAALCLATLTVIILSEIAVRMLSGYIEGFPAGVPMAWELSAYLMGTAFMAGAAMTLRAGSHIRVGILLAQLSGRGRQVLEIVASLVGLLLTGFLVYSLVQFTWGAYQRGQTSLSSDTPLWIPEAAITLGAALLALQMLARVAQACLGLPVEDPSLKAGGSGE